MIFQPSPVTVYKGYINQQLLPTCGVNVCNLIMATILNSAQKVFIIFSFPSTLPKQFININVNIIYFQPNAYIFECGDKQ